MLFGMGEKIWEGTQKGLRLFLFWISSELLEMNQFLKPSSIHMSSNDRQSIGSLDLTNPCWQSRSSDFFVLLSQLKVPLTTLKSALSDLSISYTPPIPPPSSIPVLLRSILSISSRACYLAPIQQWARSTNRHGSVQTMGGFGGAVEEVKRGSRRIWALFMVPRIGFDSMWKIFLLVYTLNIIQDRLQTSQYRESDQGVKGTMWQL